MHTLILRNFALHVKFSTAEQDKLIALLKQKTAAKRFHLLQAGETQRQIYFVNKGCLRLFHTDADGTEHNLCFFPENWWACDIVSFFKAKPATYFIQSIEDTELLCFTLDELEELFASIPKLERFFRILTQNGFELLQRRVIANLSKSAEERYFEFRKIYPGLEQRISQKNVASYLGITAAFLSMLRRERK